MENFETTLTYLYSRLPMFTRQGASALKNDLTNTIALCNALNNPHHLFPAIHIGGTNGKGSVSSMTAAIFTACGYKTGLYTSPHLKSFTERIRIDGKEVPESYIVAFVQEHKALIEAIEPSFFEVTVAMAFDYFAREKVDIAIIEVGLGGRLDSTNIITPELSVITNISYDHTDLLGETLAEIAFEKAGIIKKEIPVVIGEKHPETAPVFTEKALKENSPLYFAEENFSGYRTALSLFQQTVTVQGPEKTENYTLDLIGDYQIKNLATVLQAVDCMRNQGWNLPEDKVKTALSEVKRLSGLKGRMEILGEKPLIIADTGHNEAGIRYVLGQIQVLGGEKKLHFVWGMVRDKSHEKVLAMLPQDAAYYFVSPDIPRGLPSAEMQAKAMSFGLKGKHYLSVKDGLEAAIGNAGENDLIFVGGSTFVVAEAL